MVALPAIASYNYFQRVIKARITRADSFGKEVLALLKSEKLERSEELDHRLEQLAAKSTSKSGTMLSVRHVA